MKNVYPILQATNARLAYILTLLTLIFLFSFPTAYRADGQTALSPGDIAIFQMNLTTNKLGFVVLKPLQPNTVIYFSDLGWDNVGGNFHQESVNGSTEGIFQWTTGSAVPAGSLFYFTASASGPFSCTFLNATTNTDITSQLIRLKAPASGDLMTASGENFFFYQEPETDRGFLMGNPRFICGMNNNNKGLTNSTGWSEPFTTGHGITSSLPNSNGTKAGLTNGVNAVGFIGGTTSTPNVVYIGSTTPADAATWAARFNDPSNYTRNNTAQTSLPASLPVSAAASITASGTLNSLSTVSGTPSSTTSFTVSGEGLSAGIQIAAPVGFELSLAQNGSFSSPIVVGTGGNIPPATIYVRLAASAGPGNYSGNIVLSSSGASTVNMPTAPSTVAAPMQSSIASQTNVSCNGGSNGNVTITVSGGSPPYAYSWFPSGGTGATATGLSAGLYTCTITDAYGNRKTQDVTILQPGAISTSPSQTNVSCNGGLNGAASVVVTGGTSPLTYNWSPGTPAGDGTSSVTGLAAGAWSVTVTDANGCVAVKNFTITQPSALSLSSSQTNVSCNGGSNGSASITAAGGITPYTYAWSPTGGNSAFVSGLQAGAYAVTLTDANGCVQSKTITITQPPAMRIQPSQQDAPCFGAATGSASANVSGGVRPYAYTWSPSGGSNATAAGLTAGTYTVNVTDANGCGATQNYTITEPAQLLITATQTNVTCNGGSNGAASVNVSGGTPSYTYEWIPSVGNGPSATSLSAGNYKVKVTDGSNCSSIKQIIITEPAALVSSVNITAVSCYGNSDGSAAVTVNGGTGSYSFSWSPAGGNTATATGLPGGNYSCTLSDMNGCSKVQPVTIPQPQALAVSLSSVSGVSCNGGGNGSATVSVTGGTAPFSYSWSPSGGNAATASNLAAGNYTCTVTDARGCQSSVNAGINSPSALSASLASVSHTTCNGGSNGSATVAATGGTAPYSYNWSGQGGTAATGTGFSTGTYTCTITDANGCIRSLQATIDQPSALSANISSKTNVTCSGGSNGAAAVSVSGGTQPCTYLWSPSGGSGANASGLTTGNYTVFVTDANNCRTSATVSITAETILSTQVSSQTNLLCSNGSNGSATVGASGGTPFQSSGPQSFSNGTSYNIPDANTAGILSPVSVTGISGLTGTKLAQVQFNINHPYVGDLVISLICPDGNEILLVSREGGPQANYTSTTFAIAGSDIAQDVAPFSGTYAPLDPFSNLSSCTINGTWKLKVTDEAGGDVGTLLNWKITFTAPSGSGDYQYSWSPSGGSAAKATGLSAGRYTCTVTDANNCFTTQEVIITAPQGISSAISGQTAVSCNGGSDGTVTLSVSGGTGTLQYSWSPSGGNAATASQLSAGTYTCTISDNNGCSTTQQVTIIQPASLSVSETHNNVSCFSGSDGSVNLTVSGGTQPYTYLWSPDHQTTEDISSLKAGNYSCTVTDAHGCTATKAVIITETTPVTATISATGTTCNGGSNGTATVVAGGGTGQLIYQWSPSGGTAATASNLQAGFYTCTITDENNCIKIMRIEVEDAAGINIHVNRNDVTCNGKSTGSAAVTASGGAGNFSFAWSPSGGSGSTASQLAAGDHTVTVTDALGCIKDTTIKILQPAPINIALVGTTDVSCFGGSNGTASVNASGGNGNFSYSWSPSGNQGSFATALSAGNYTCTVTDGSQCQQTRTISISQPTVLVPAITTQTGVGCNGGSDGQVTLGASGGIPQYSYRWSTGETTATRTGLKKGTYSCTISDANFCQAVQQVTITEPATLSASIASAVDVTCNGFDNGKATAAATGGTSPYSFSWGSNGNQALATSLIPGNHTCTVTDAKGCTASATATIIEPAVLTGSLLFSSNAKCHGEASGNAGVMASGGISPYQYTWSNGANTPTANNLLAGTYSCEIKDANGCKVTVTGISINEPSTSLSVSISHTDVTCSGSSNGSAIANPQGGTPGYTASWAPFGGNSGAASNLPSGTYTCTIKDANGCETSKSVTISVPSPLSVTASTIHVSCYSGSDGSVSLFTSGGTQPYLYKWSNGSTMTAINNLPAGTYTCEVTDANQCKETVQIPINQPQSPLSAVLSSVDVSCYGGTNGSAAVTASGGTSPYTYRWNPANSNQSSISSLQAGQYRVTVTDSKLCTLERTVIINQPADLTAQTYPSNPGCYGYADGTASVVPSGGAQPYTYNWSPQPAMGQGSSVADKLTAGTWTCTITDKNSCTINKDVVLADPAELNVSLQDLTPVCLDQVPFPLSGGSPAGGAYSGNGASNGQFDPSAAGTGTHVISYTYTDATGCFKTVQKDIVVKALPTLNILHPQPLCADDDSMCLKAVPTGGTWTGSGISKDHFIPNAQLVGMNPVTYTYTNPNTGCTNHVTTNIEVRAVPSPSVYAPSTAFCANAFMTLTVNSVFEDYAWYHNGVPVLNANDRTFDAKDAGNYEVKVTLAGCEATAAIQMQTLAVPVPDVSFLGINSFCDTGKVGLTTGSYQQYQWFRNDILIPAADAKDYIAATAGSYTVKVFDGQCYGTAMPMVLSGYVPIALAVYNSHGPIFCPGEAFDLMASPAVKYQWIRNGQDINGANSATYTVTQAGDYAVKGTDKDGCEVTTSAVSFAQGTKPVPVLDYVGSLQFCEGQTVKLSTTHFERYKWRNNGTVIPGASVNVLYVQSSGLYTVEVTNKEGCADISSSLEVKVFENPDVQLNYPGLNIICENEDPILSVAGNGASYTWLLNNSAVAGQTGPTLAIKESGSYAVKVISFEGCQATSGVSVIVLKEAPEIPVIQAERDTLATGPAAAYQWYKNEEPMPGATDRKLVVFENGRYMVEVFNTLDCSAFSEPVNLTNVSVEVLSNMHVFDVYPNSFAEIFTISASHAGTFALRDMSGKLVLGGRFQPGINLVNTGMIAAGIYQLELQTGDVRKAIKMMK